jgi:hypothetical protein
VKRNLIRLGKDKLVKETLGKWRTTPAGEKELNAMDTARGSGAEADVSNAVAAARLTPQLATSADLDHGY